MHPLVPFCHAQIQLTANLAGICGQELEDKYTFAFLNLPVGKKLGGDANLQECRKYFQEQF